MRKIACILFIFVLASMANPSAALSQVKEANDGGPPLLDIILVLDNSGSMKKNDPKFLTLEVVTNFLEGLDENARLGMVIFDTQAELAEPLAEMTSPEARGQFLQSLKKVDYQGQLTNSPAAIERAIYELKRQGRAEARKVIIFLTDGIVDTGNKARDAEKRKWLKEDLAEESRKAGIKIFGVAFTENADFSMIQSLSSETQGEYFRAFLAEDIQGVFNDIKEAITKPEPPAEPPAATAAVQPEPVTTQPPSATDEAAPATAEPPAGETAASTVQEPAAIQPSPSSQEPSTTSEPEVVVTPPEKAGLPLGYIVAGAVVVLGLILLVFVMKKGKKEESGPQDRIQRPDPPGPKQEPLPEAHLLDINGVVSKTPIKLDQRLMRIGREAGNDLAIQQTTVSGLHATIEYKDQFFYLEDQRSSNGTSLNGKPIESNKPMKLKSGDEISFDAYKFKFVIPGSAPSGGTVLAVGGAQRGSGTVLRSGKPEAKQPEAGPDPSTQKEAGSDPEPLPEPSIELGGTKVKARMCPNHPAIKATELCAKCKTAFCARCMTNKDGQDMCLECAKSI